MTGSRPPRKTGNMPGTGSTRPAAPGRPPIRAAHPRPPPAASGCPREPGSPQPGGKLRSGSARILGVGDRPDYHDPGGASVQHLTEI